MVEARYNNSFVSFYLRCKKDRSILMIIAGYTHKSAMKMILALQIFFSAIVLAQNTSVTPLSHIQPEKIKYPKNLSQNQVNCILQDHKGYLWIGTKDGLNRYDGYQIIVYSHDPFDTTSLSNNFVTAVLEDSQQRIWVGTLQGLNLLDRTKNVFRRILSDTAKSNGLSYNDVRDIAEDLRGNILVATWGDGLNVLTPPPGKQIYGPLRFEYIQHQPGDFQGLSNNHVRQVIVDDNGIIWATTWAIQGAALQKIDYDDQGNRYKISHFGSAEFDPEWRNAIESGNEVL